MTVPTGSVMFGPEHGQLVVRISREGFAAGVGDDPTFEVTQWSAQLDAPGGDPASASLTATIELDSMVVRDGTGGAQPLTGDIRREIEQNARQMLTAGGSATAVFHSTQVSAEPARWLIDGMLTLHGTTAPLQFEVSSPAPDQYVARAAIIQSRYGIRPYSGFLGAVKVRDEVGIEMEVDLR